MLHKIFNWFVSKEHSRGENMFEENTLIGKIAKGEFPRKIVNTDYGEFVVQFPSGMDSRVIGRKAASFCNGMPLNSFDMSNIMSFEIDATLSVVIKEFPADFPKDWKEDGIVNFPNQEVKNFLFKEFNTFYSETQKGLSKES